MQDNSDSNAEILPREVQGRLARGEKFLFVDVREVWEHDISRIEGSTLIPMREIPANLARLNGAGDVVVFCHHGMRSLDVTWWLRSQGMERVWSMAGGIDRWAAEIDPGVSRY